MRRREQRDGPDAKLTVRVGREAQRESERTAVIGQGEEVRGAGRERSEPAREGVFQILLERR